MVSLYLIAGFLFAGLTICHAGHAISDEEMREKVSKCSGESSVTFDEFQKAREDNFMHDDNQNMKCLVKCLLTNEGVLTETGAIMLTSKFEKFTMCAHVDGEPCEKAHKFIKCVYENKGDEDVE